jgi:hypothetical protein
MRGAAARVAGGLDARGAELVDVMARQMDALSHERVEVRGDDLARHVRRLAVEADVGVADCATPGIDADEKDLWRAVWCERSK